MWYKAMPSLAIIGVFIYGTHAISAVVANLFFDKPFRPSNQDIWYRNMLERDARILGVPWKQPEDALKDVKDI